VKTLGSAEGEIGIGFTYRVESNSIIYRNEYPFNHVWPDEGQPLRKYIPENGFNIDSISSEFLFSHPNSIERTKILPVLSKTVFSVIFYQQKKRYIKDIEKGAYILKWIISESEDKKQYDLEETFIFPDGKMVGIFKEKKPFLPIEVIHNAEFKEKLSGQFSLEKNKTYCVLNHFLPGIINRKINYMYFGFLFFIKLILDTLGYDNNIIQINKAEELHILKDMPASFKILFSECYTVSKKIKEDTEFKARLNKSLQDDKITAFIDLLNGYNKIIDDWKKRGGKDLLDRIRLHQIYYKHIKPLIDGAEIAQYDSLYFIRKHLSRFLSFFSKSIYYLGPLREDPKPLYPYPNNDDSFDLGRKGEHTASVLFLHGARPATDIPLPDQEKTQNNAGDTITVKAAIKQWLAYIGVAGDIEAKILGKTKGAMGQWLLNHSGVADIIDDYLEEHINDYDYEDNIGTKITRKIARN
jgi:hypothetical protein